MPDAVPTTKVTPSIQQDLLAELEELRARVSARNADLTEEEAEELADRLVNEAIDSLAERGELVFERDLKP
jgi:hypothetical protein